MPPHSSNRLKKLDSGSLYWYNSKAAVTFSLKIQSTQIKRFTVDYVFAFFENWLIEGNFIEPSKNIICSLEKH